MCSQYVYFIVKQTLNVLSDMLIVNLKYIYITSEGSIYFHMIIQSTTEKARSVIQLTRNSPETKNMVMSYRSQHYTIPTKCSFLYSKSDRKG